MQERWMRTNSGRTWEERVGRVSNGYLWVLEASLAHMSSLSLRRVIPDFDIVRLRGRNV